jgi:signal transduction histidine kinase
LVLDRAQAAIERAESAVLAERARLAHDLHDTVIQRLFGIGLEMQGLRMTIDQPEIATRIDRVIDSLDATIAELRRTIFELPTETDPALRP